MDRAQRAHMERALGVTTTVLFVASVSYIALTALYACFCDGGRRGRDDDGGGGGGAARGSSSSSSEETKRALEGIPVHVVRLVLDGDDAGDEGKTLSREEEEEVDKEAGGADCAVCLAEYAAGDEVRVLPACRHGFHRECVDRWLLTRAPTCPVCRAPVVARVEEGADAKDHCGDGESGERRGGGIGFLPVAGGSRVLPAILP
ncbi:E3 ubiquitin-protein ligase EL5-like [Oryza brachyantha]|uniref:E3 ubiquitin-protein ligase EL5-like n=1 Tax=Oryza brachyantha TaxID=4533 RepID=UPI001AD9E196|nr:E3 ubiquitin-protein ligase EL5-like [Oryza brachyantha]